MAQNQDNTRNQSTSSQSGSQGQDVNRKPSTGTQSAGGQSGQGSQTGSSGGNNYSFRCQDAGHQQCNWQTQGSSEDEVLRNVEPHARQHHNISNFGEVRDKVRGLIRRVAA